MLIPARSDLPDHFGSTQGSIPAQRKKDRTFEPGDRVIVLDNAYDLSYPDGMLYLKEVHDDGEIGTRRSPLRGWWGKVLSAPPHPDPDEIIVNLVAVDLHGSVNGCNRSDLVSTHAWLFRSGELDHVD